MIEPLPPAVRAAYDMLAPDHADRLGTDLAAKPLDRAMPAVVAELLGEAGFDVQARLLREPYETEGVRQACLLARELGQA